jgi:NADH-quinone oxidoreductase subunit E
MLLSEESIKKLRELKDKFPDRRTAILPALHLVYDQFGYIGNEQLQEAAEIIDLPYLELAENASFYTMFPKKPVGKYFIQVCNNLSCALLGADSLVDYLLEKLNLKLGETTPDGLFTVVTVECLGSCGSAPMMQVNDEYYENLTRKKVEELLEEFRRNGAKGEETPS